MKATIEINCANAGDLLQHLNQIRRTIEIRSRGDMDYDFEVGFHATAVTRQGDHELTILSDKEYEP